MKTSQVAKLLGVSMDTVRRRCEAGAFPGAAQSDLHSGMWHIPKVSVYGRHVVATYRNLSTVACARGHAIATPSRLVERVLCRPCAACRRAA